MTPVPRKQRRQMNTINGSFSDDATLVSSTSKDIGIDLERLITPTYNPFNLSDEAYKNMLLRHKRKKMDVPDDIEVNTNGITMSDVIQRTKLNYVKKLNNVPSAPPKPVEVKPIVRKRHKKDHIYDSQSPPEFSKVNHVFNSSNSEYESDSDSIDTVLSSKSKSRSRAKLPKPKSNSISKVIKEEVKQEPVSFVEPKIEKTSSPDINLVKNTMSQYGKVTPATLSDLDGIDMMNLPIDLDDSNIDILDINNKPELMQETHANFLSLIRDIICSTNEHRMSMATLEERLKAWQENPISPLNDWYNYMDNWVTALRSAIDFLSGNCSYQDDFVPYIVYNPQLDMYQWIGAGRDSDSLFSPLCEFWLEHRNEVKNDGPAKESEDLDVRFITITTLFNYKYYALV